MIRLLPEVIEPRRWFVAFHRTSPYWWVRLLAAGRYKHVSAFAWVPEVRLWLVYEVAISGTRLVLLPDGENATRRLAELTLDADLLHISVEKYNRKYNCRPMPFSCVSAVAHLIGIRRCVATPTGLWRLCLEHGGEVVGTVEPARAADRPADLAAAEAGRGGSPRRDSGPAVAGDAV